MALDLGTDKLSIPTPYGDLNLIGYIEPRNKMPFYQAIFSGVLDIQDKKYSVTVHAINEVKENAKSGWRLIDFSDAPIPSPFEIDITEFNGEEAKKLDGYWLVPAAEQLLYVVFCSVMGSIQNALSKPDGLAWMLADRKRWKQIGEAMNEAEREFARH